MSAQTQTNSVPMIPRLAIIDDAEFDQMLYKRLIDRTGLVGETLAFLSAEEALDYFESPDSAPVDVILLDINMPGLSGFDFLERASTSTGCEFTDVIVVMLTTSLDPSDVERAKKYDLVRDYINKPLETQHLQQISELLIGLHSEQA